MPLMEKFKETFRFDRRYFIKFLIVLFLEIFIALYIHDKFIRPYVGDILVMVLMYLFIKSFYSSPTKRLPYYLFIFACLIELSQLFNLVHLLGLENNSIIRIVLGSTFDVIDIVCYGIGMLLLIGWENMLRKNIAYL